jgi:hypothetical protein
MPVYRGASFTTFIAQPYAISSALGTAIRGEKMTGHKTEAVYRRYAITDSAMLQEAALKLAALYDAEEKRQSNSKVDPILAVS